MPRPTQRRLGSASDGYGRALTAPGAPDGGGKAWSPPRASHLQRAARAARAAAVRGVDAGDGDDLDDAEDPGVPCRPLARRTRQPLLISCGFRFIAWLLAPCPHAVGRGGGGSVSGSIVYVSISYDMPPCVNLCVV